MRAALASPADHPARAAIHRFMSVTSARAFDLSASSVRGRYRELDGLVKDARRYGVAPIDLRQRPHPWPFRGIHTPACRSNFPTSPPQFPDPLAAGIRLGRGTQHPKAVITRQDLWISGSTRPAALGSTPGFVRLILLVPQ